MHGRSRRSLSRRVARPAGLAAACALAVATAAACGSSSSTPSASGSPAAAASGTVTYWSSSTPAEITYIDTQFDKAHPGIRAVGQYIASADESTAKEIAAIKSGTEPDVVIGQDPSALPLLAESGKIADLTAGLKTQTAELYPGIKNALFYLGKQLGIALGGVGDYEWISYDWESVLESNGGSIVTGDGSKTAFNSPAGVAALTLWQNLVRRPAENRSGPAVDPGLHGDLDRSRDRDQRGPHQRHQPGGGAREGSRDG
jgi:ABC-type glycerol-3-phosphate transport system substrate-binding protein